MPRKVIQVRFPISVSISSARNSEFDTSTKSYSYWTDDDSIQVNDSVLVATGVPPRVFPKVATVCKVSGLSKDAINRASKWIVGKIDLNDYLERMKRESAIADIRASLRQRMEEMEDIKFMLLLSKTDPVTRQLLDELRVIDPEAVPQLPSEHAGEDIIITDNDLAKAKKK